MKFFLIALPLCILGVSCERHDFEETKKLHSHGSHAADHGDSHGSHGDEHHGEKKEEHGAH